MNVLWTATHKVRSQLGAGNCLIGLHEIGNDSVVLLGTTQSLISRDRGITWEPFFDQLRDGKVHDVITNAGEDYVFAHCDGQTSVWNDRNDWVQSSQLPEASWLSSSFLEDGSLVAGLSRDGSIEIFGSNDLGKTWNQVIAVREPDTPVHFAVDPSGIALCIFLDITEMADGADFLSNLAVLDLHRKEVLYSRSLRANIQSVCRCGNGAWILGANGGLVFRFQVGDAHLKTYAALDDDDLNVTGLHLHGQNGIIVAEESMPPGAIKVFATRQGVVGPAIATGIQGFSFGSAWIGDTVLIATPDEVYRGSGVTP